MKSSGGQVRRLNSPASTLVRWLALGSLSAAFTLWIGVSPVSAQVFVTVNRGLGNMPIAVIDSDPGSPTFNQIVAIMDSDLNGSNSIAFTLDGAFAWVTSCCEPRLGVFNLLYNRLDRVISFDPLSGSHRVAMGTEGLAYVAQAGPNQILIFDSADYSLVGTIPLDQAPVDLSIRPDGRFLYTTNSNFLGTNVFVIDTLTREVSRTILIPNADGQGLRFSPDGAFAYMVKNCNLPGAGVVVIDTLSYAVRELPPYVRCPRPAAFRPDGGTVYFPDVSRVSVFDTQTNSWTTPIELPNPRAAGLMTVSSQYYAYVTSHAVGEEDVVYVIDTLTNRIISTISGFQGSLGVINSM